jgi:regulator of nucleoside diphosphate kinase
MNVYISTMIVLGLYLVGVLLVILVSRVITRTDLYRRWTEKRGKHYPRSRVIEDLRPVQETMIEFIDASPPSRGLLQRLADADAPIPVRKLLRTVPAGEGSWTALFLIAVAGLVRFGPQGVLITDLGREILARMSGDTTEAGHHILNCEPAVAEERLQSRAARNGTERASDTQVVTVAFDRNEHAHLSQRTKPIRSFEHGHVRALSKVFSASDRQARSNAEKRSAVMLTPADHRELTQAIVAAKKLAAHKRETRALQEKLADAIICPTGQIPRDVITLYSRAELLDLETDEQLKLMLVFPIDSNLEQGRISVFAPLGIAMLGRRVGDRFDWTVPYGVRRFEVTAVHFQPEAALAKAA